MQAWMRTWRGATALAAGCLLLGLVRVVSAPLDELTVIAFLVAVGYTLAAVVDRRAEHPRQVVPATVAVTPSTRDRLAALLATAAAIVGLLLVVQDRETDDDRTPAGPAPSVSEISIPLG